MDRTEDAKVDFEDEDQGNDNDEVDIEGTGYHNSATASISETEETPVPMNSEGNRLHQEDCVVGPQRTHMWLVKEGGQDSKSGIWWRRAFMFSKFLEDQFQSRIGCQQCEIYYENYFNRGPTVHYYTHDLSSENQWVQRRYLDENRMELMSEKQIIRVILG